MSVVIYNYTHSIPKESINQIKVHMKKKIFIAISIVAIIGISVILFMFNMSHRDVSKSKVDFEIEAIQLVKEFVDDPSAANEKYLAEDGASKILSISGRIDQITTDKLGQKVVLLKPENDRLGVSVTFTIASNNQLNTYLIGDKIRIKGVIRSGAEYDDDLDLAEDAIIEKATLVI